jgi:uncharacterized protein YqeY
MKIKESLNELIMNAMKNGDKIRTEALRSIKTAFMNWETAKENVGKTLDEAAEISVLKKLLTQYEDTAVQCNDGKHEQLVKEAIESADVIRQFLPVPATEDDIRIAFNNVLSENIEPIKKNMGLFIKRIKELLPNADGKMISQIVGKNLH